MSISVFSANTHHDVTTFQVDGIVYINFDSNPGINIQALSGKHIELSAHPLMTIDFVTKYEVIKRDS